MNKYKKRYIFFLTLGLVGILNIAVDGYVTKILTVVVYAVGDVVFSFGIIWLIIAIFQYNWWTKSINKN